MMTDDLPIDSNPGPNIKMKDALETGKGNNRRNRKARRQQDILLSHRGYPADLDLAAKVDGIDLIVGGHTHTLLGDPQS